MSRRVGVSVNSGPDPGQLEAVLDELQELMMYTDAVPAIPPVASKQTLRQLRVLGFITDEHLLAIADVVDHIRDGRTFIDDQRLLLAWLDAFEILANGDMLAATRQTADTRGEST